MRKAFDTNVPKLKPRLRPAMIAVSETTNEAQEKNSSRYNKQQISRNKSVPADVSDSAPANTPEPVSAAIVESTPPEINPEDDKIVQFPDTRLPKENLTEETEDSLESCSAQTQNASPESQTTESTAVQFFKTTDSNHSQNRSSESANDFTIDNHQNIPETLSYRSTTISPEIPVTTIEDSGSRRKRLEEVKRKVAEAVRPEVSIEPVPEDPALAVESVLGLVNELEAQLSNSRDLEKALRDELAETKAELTRTINEGRTASGKLGQAEMQLVEKRKVLEEMLFEMSALEEERDQAVRMVQILTAKDQGRQQELDELGNRYSEIQRALEESKTEEERLTAELDDCITENTRLNTLLAEITRERDTLARNVEKLIRERDELSEAKKALEKVHHALSQARARLRE